ncbi:MAG: glycosyltransferase, partial [Chthoniobacteraceae bacterium]
MKGLSVLSFGFTRGLWEGDHAEDVQRMRAYAGHLDAYVVIANSYKRHRLAPLRLASNFDAIPTNAFCFADSFFRMIRIGARVLRERRITLIQAQDPCFTGIAAALLGWRFGVPVNVCVYGPNVFDPHWVASHWSHPLLAHIGGWMLRHADGIQVDGKMTARSLIAAGLDPARVHVKPVVPANLDRFLAIERTPRETPPRVLFAGRLALQKNLPLLIDAARLLRERGRKFELQIVGDGPEENPLRAHAAKSGFNGELQFRAAVPREEIAEVFAAADVFALSSDYEGYPRVLMEAAAAGLPIVTTAVSGSDEAVADGETGSIVPVGDAAAFAEKLDLLLGDSALRIRMGAAARQRMRTQLDPTTNTPAQLEIWRKIARGTEAPGSARVSRAGEGVPPSRTSLTLANADTSSESIAVESPFRRDAETSTRDASAP